MDALEEFNLARIQDLEEQILKARTAYYNDTTPIISDAEFDTLIEELASLKADSPAVISIGDTPSQDSTWPKVRHFIPMGSLDKAQTGADLENWSNKISNLACAEYLISEKLDGISISVTYESGNLTSAVTRGDGEIGEDITPNVAKMQGIPSTLGTCSVTLRGEIILHREKLEKNFPGASNPRNTASGTSKRSDGDGCEHLSVYFYQVYGPEFSTDDEQYAWLASHNLQHPNYYVMTAETILALWEDYQNTLREALPYDIDGLVIRLNNLKQQLTLGEIHGRPRGAIALKFPPVIRETKSTGLESQVGGQGNITPVGIVEPVNILGTQVCRASLYNWRYVKQIGFHIGAVVRITKSNDVIPRIVSTVDPSQSPCEPPTECPECGAATEWKGEYLTCPNTIGCPAQVEGRLKRWVQELGILEWGDSLIEKVASTGLAIDVPSLYRLTEAQLAALDRMGPTSAKKAIAQLWAPLPLPLEKFVGALGIPLCATSTIELAISAGLDTLDKLREAKSEDFQVIPGFGPKRAKSLSGWLDRGNPLLREMLAVGIEIKTPTTGNLTGSSFCFTGTMTTKRPILERMAKEAGAKVKKSVGQGLTYLVIADPNSTSTKAEASRKNGTRCISENEFLEMVGA